MKQLLFLVLLLSTFVVSLQNKIDYSQVSQDLLQCIIERESPQENINILAEGTLTDLENQLKTDQQKIAFWANVYNAFIQISLSENPKLYKDKSKFFSKKRIKIAGKLLSFHDIELLENLK